MHVLDFILSMKVKSLLNIMKDLNVKMNLLIWILVFAQSAGAVEYTDCTSAEG